MKNTIKKICVTTCVLFSIIVLIVCSGVAMVGVNTGFGIDHTIIFALFVFSFIFSFTTVIYYQTKLNNAIKYIIHLIITLGASSLFLRIVNRLEGKTILVSVIIIAVLHAASFAVIHAIKSTTSKEEKYESIYSKKDR